MNNTSKIESDKRENSVYAEPFKYDSVIKLQQDSFVNTEYKEAFSSTRSQNKPIPPKPEMLESEKLLLNEVDRLREERQIKLENFAKKMAINCSTELRDSIILNLTVKPNGRIENYNVAKASKSGKLKENCLDEFLRKTKVNLGKLKVAPSARTGTTAQNIYYTLPIK